MFIGRFSLDVGTTRAASNVNPGEIPFVWSRATAPFVFSV